MSVPERAGRPEAGRPVTAPSRPAPAAGVQIEVISWVTKFTGGDGTGRRVFEEPAQDATVRSVLTALSRRFPELQTALWHGTEIGEHIEVLVNDAVLGLTHTLDSRLAPGDHVTLLGQYMGG